MSKFVVVCILIAAIACLRIDSAIAHKPFDPWYAACEAVEEEYSANLCEGLDRPEVVQTQLLRLLRALGLFVHDEPYVFVGDEDYLKQYNVTYDEVVFHETIHYILWHSETERVSCESEAMARKLTAKVFDIPEDPYGCTTSPSTGGMGI
jgi:hypothetical protein